MNEHQLTRIASHSKDQVSLPTASDAYTWLILVSLSLKTHHYSREFGSSAPNLPTTSDACDEEQAALQINISMCKPLTYASS